jgi:predicted dehydrogenase
MSQITSIAIIGAGGRGAGFANIINDYKHLGEVVAVAEPRDDYRKHIQETCNIPDDMAFASWEDFFAKDKLCDAVVIATMDQDHVGPAVAAQEKGYHMMLEKPMAVSLEDCEAIAAAQKVKNVTTAVCHSMRYNKGFAIVKEIVDSGRIGKVVSLDQLEQVAFWHQAHSFVRGNWGNEGRSTFMLMAKSCHDIDYINYLIGKKCLSVSSFGALSYFNEANAPEGSTDRCTDGCAVESSCPYSAIKAYVHANREGWPAAVCSYDHSVEAHLEAIKSGPYGKCVYRCDNDVVDHQTVNMLFENDITATFTMTAFTLKGGRILRVHGTEGELRYDENEITIHSFLTENVETIKIGAEVGGHGGGDNRVIRSWLEAIHTGDVSKVTTDVHESLRTHKVVFAAEQSRLEKRMVEL